MLTIGADTVGVVGVWIPQNFGCGPPQLFGSST